MKCVLPRTEAEVRGGVLRVHRERGAVGHHGAGAVALLLERDAEVEVRGRELRVRRDLRGHAESEVTQYIRTVSMQLELVRSPFVRVWQVRAT